MAGRLLLPSKRRAIRRLYPLLLGGSSGGSAASAVKGARADGTNDWLNGVSPAGTDNTDLTWAFFIKPQTGGGANQDFHYGTSGKFVARINTVDSLNLTWLDSAFATKFNKNGIGITLNVWNVIIASIRTSDAANSHVYLGTSPGMETEVTSLTINAGNFDHSGTEHGIFARPDGTIKMNGELAFFYYTNEYLDISVTANLRKYVNADGTPNFSGMGADGSGLTGTQPLVFLPNSYLTFHQNAGSAGDFTLNGALDEGTSIVLGS